VVLFYVFLSLVFTPLAQDGGHTVRHDSQSAFGAIRRRLEAFSDSQSFVQTAAGGKNMSGHARELDGRTSESTGILSRPQEGRGSDALAEYRLLAKSNRCDRAETGLDLQPDRARRHEDENLKSMLSGFELTLQGDLKGTEAPRQHVAQLAGDEFAAVALTVLEKLDTKHCGEITRKQLVRAIEDPSFVGREAQALVALYHGFDMLHNLSGNEGRPDRQSINAADLVKYAQIQQQESQRRQDAAVMKFWAQRNLSRFDADGSGSLTRDEIAAGLQVVGRSEDDRKMLKTIEKHYSSLGHWWESGVNLKALEDFADNVHSDTAHARLVSDVYASCYNVARGQKSEASRDLFGDTENPLASINARAILQGSIGDCYFVASLAAVAETHPELIRNAIKDNADGTYTVTFPGDREHPVKIKAPTEAEQGLYNHGSANGLWASVMEKAYGEYCWQHFKQRPSSESSDGKTTEDGADGGGLAYRAMELLLGTSVSTEATYATQSTIAALLIGAFDGKRHKAVTTTINRNLLPFSAKETADKFYRGHAYTITGFQSDGKGGGQVTVRNPWGVEDGTPSGTITISLEKFRENFSSLAVEK
jgi:hypothetical protein